MLSNRICAGDGNTILPVAKKQSFRAGACSYRVSSLVVQACGAVLHPLERRESLRSCDLDYL